LWAPEPLADVVAYIDDSRGDQGDVIDGLRIITFDTWRNSLGHMPVFVAVGNPSMRRTLVERVSAAGGGFASFYGSIPPMARGVVVGEGTCIAEYVSIGASTVIGSHVQILPLVSIDGECSVGDFTTICPSSTIYGRVIVEEGVFVGVGARIVNESDDPLTVGAGAMICAGAIVTRSVPAGQKLAGNPAQELRLLAAARRT
jgi:sugar O-acyltransferase (sialic acid O-acetyltransferase NeuD family)